MDGRKNAEDLFKNLSSPPLSESMIRERLRKVDSKRLSDLVELCRCDSIRDTAVCRIAREVRASKRTTSKRASRDYAGSTSSSVSSTLDLSWSPPDSAAEQDGDDYQP